MIYYNKLVFSGILTLSPPSFYSLRVLPAPESLGIISHNVAKDIYRYRYIK